MVASYAVYVARGHGVSISQLGEVINRALKNKREGFYESYRLTFICGHYYKDVARLAKNYQFMKRLG